jgi:negative regulator of flagellin synthesis FlgM
LLLKDSVPAPTTSTKASNPANEQRLEAIMEIKNSDKLNIPSETGVAKTAGSRLTADAKSRAAKAAEAVASSDRVTLTPAAQLLVAAEHADAGDAPVDHARVDALRAAIANGTHRVNAEHIAKRLIKMDNDR